MTTGAGTLAGLGFLSSVGSSISQSAQGKAEAAQAELNAKISETQGVLLKEGHKLDEFKKRKAMRNFTGEQVTLFAKAGVTFSGSVIDVIQEDIANAELDLAIDSINSRMGVRALQSQADASRQQGRDIRTASNIRAGKTLLSAGAKFASKYSVPSKASKIGDSGLTVNAKGNNLTIGGA